MVATSGGPATSAQLGGHGDFAFDARMALSRQAERSIDAQYYHLRPDGTGRALLHTLRDAAARGVRVRLLVDDFHAAPIDDLLLEITTHDVSRGERDGLARLRGQSARNRQREDIRQRRRVVLRHPAGELEQPARQNRTIIEDSQ